MNRLIPILLALIIFAACDKDNDSNNDKPSLVGKWKNIEMFSTAPTSCSCWVAIPAGEYNHFKLEFKKSGMFQATPPMYVSAAYCPSSYTIEGDSLVWNTGICGPSMNMVKSHFLFQGKDTLIIEYSHIPNYFYKMKFIKTRQF